MGGWIKAYRDLMDHPVWQDNLMFKAWMDLLLRVNHQDKKILFKKDFVVVGKGQTITSLRKLAASWLCHKDTVKRILCKFQAEDMITFECDNEKTLINVVNYSVYQGEDTPKQDSEQDSHADSHTTQTRMIKNEKNEKNIKRGNFVPPSVEEVRAYCSERKNGIDPESFIAFYQSKGWMIGKNKMKDWKAAVRTWEQRNRKDRKVDEDEEQRKQHGTDWTDHFFDCK